MSGRIRLPTEEDARPSRLQQTLRHVATADSLHTWRDQTRYPRIRVPLALLVAGLTVTLCTTLGIAPISTLVDVLQAKAASALTGFSGVPSQRAGDDDAFEDWIGGQANYSWTQLQSHIGYPGTNKGAIIASPSRDEPDYWFQWTRDGALVMDVVVSEYRTTHDNNTLQKIFDYVDETEKLQHTETSVGGYRTGGLGDVKWNVDGTPFFGPWCRPQYDGPALRAITLIRFAYEYSRREGLNAVPLLNRLYDGKFPTNSIIKADLEFVANNFDQPSCDLWEEVRGMHHFTLLASRRALLLGARFAIDMHDSGAADYYKAKAAEVSVLLEKFWDERRGYIVASLNYTDDHGKDSWLDVGTLLGALHGSPSREEDGDESDDGQDDWDWNDERMLATHAALVKSMRKAYKINAQLEPTSAAAIGRYVEDVYDGAGMSYGNPWFLCTLACAEVIYRHVEDRTRVGYFNITPTSLPFYHTVTSSIDPQIVETTSANGQALSRSLTAYADGFLKIVQQYQHRNGSMSEQFDRYEGFPRGARDLTWSYAAFLTAVRSRNQVL